MRLLSDDELNTLSTYKHSVSKTSLECWLIDGPLGYVERMIPNYLSANSLTLLGQLPVLSILLYVFAREGLNISPDSTINPLIFVAVGLIVEWFSLIDIIDGQRARRMKVGSPLGRFIDEAGDCIVMSNYCILLGYMLNYDNKWWET